MLQMLKDFWKGELISGPYNRGRENGLREARMIADNASWRHNNGLGPELNCVYVSQRIRDRLTGYDK